jgi:cysteine-rich repeat protein
MEDGLCEIDTSSCTAQQATPGACGDGFLNAGEQCDDGNIVGGDGCSPSCRIVENGDFSGGASPWIFYSNGVTEYDASGGEAVLAINEVGSNTQVYQKDLHLEGSTAYRVRFRGTHDDGGSVKVSVRKHITPYTSYGLAGTTLALTGTYQDYDIPFTTTAGAKTDARLMFQVGSLASGGTYRFDEIVIERVVEPGGCGDGTVDAGEQCDDGNTTSGDGCSSTCETESGGGPNLLENGDFGAGTANWSFSTNASSTFSVQSGEAVVEINTQGTSVQLYQRYVELLPERTYRLTFKGRNTGGRDLTVMVHRHGDPYTGYGLDQVFDLTTTSQTFTATFTTPQGPLYEARLRLWFSPHDYPNADYYLDDFELTEE